jgi:hypothetical protein
MPGNLNQAVEVVRVELTMFLMYRIYSPALFLHHSSTSIKNKTRQLAAGFYQVK